MIYNEPKDIAIREYHAILTQNGTEAPVATVLHNTLIGDIVWTRVSTGYYEGTLEGGLPTGRTGIIASQTSTGKYVFGAENEDNDKVFIIQEELDDPFPRADGLYLNYVIIRVYAKN